MRLWMKYVNSWFIELEELKIEVPPAKEIASHGKALARLQARCDLINKIHEIDMTLEKTRKAMNEEADEMMKFLWQEEIVGLNERLETLDKNILKAMMPEKMESVILEIRAGEGGEEASLFASELAEMYARFCKKRGWQWRIFSESFSEVGGLKEGVFEIEGSSVATWLLSEGGVHCVKRVPKTEKKGRIHTSTATVAVLPEPEELEVVIEDKDLKIDVFRSSGPGGQSVNTTDSAVRITHIPTGLVVSQQDEKSQHRNKEKALKVLRARLYDLRHQEIQEKNAETRRNVIGRGKRTERVRTYHFGHNWVKDERLEKMCYSVSLFMQSDGLDDFVEKLVWEVLLE